MIRGRSLAKPPRTHEPVRLRPTWAEIDLGRLRSNYHAFRRKLTLGTRVLAVVKADAYGHGAARCAKVLEHEGAEWLGVSSVEEGIAVRHAGVRLPILVLGSLYPFESFEACAKFQLTPTIASLEAARRLVESAERHHHHPACHVKLDTGMGRIGVSTPAVLDVLKFLHASKKARLEGLYTHLASAESDPAFTREQLGHFKDAVEAARAAGIPIPLKHAANSQGALRYPESHWDMVRPGLALYGLMDGFAPALSLKSRIVFIKHVPAGTRLGYGGTFTASRPSVIATLPVGYADGVLRALSNRGRVLVGGRPCPIAGSISMDMMMADVTELSSCSVGDEAVLLGGQGGASIGAGETADLLGTIPYEIVTHIAARVPRTYTGE